MCSSIRPAAASHLFIHLSIYPSIHSPPNHLSIHLPINQSVHPSPFLPLVHSLIHPSIHPPKRPTVQTLWQGLRFARCPRQSRETHACAEDDRRQPAPRTKWRKFRRWKDFRPPSPDLPRQGSHPCRPKPLTGRGTGWLVVGVDVWLSLLSWIFWGRP